MQAPLQHSPSEPQVCPEDLQHEPTEHDEYWYEPLKLPLLQVRVCEEHEFPHGTDDAA
jgi:hypothetical protein